MKNLLKTNKKLGILILLCCTIITNPFIVLGQSTNTSILNSEIKTINSDIQEQKKRIKKIQDKQAEYSQAIKDKQAEKATLKNQISLLENKLAKSELDIELTGIEIDQTKLEIQKTDIEIKRKNREIENERDNMTTIIKALNEKDNIDLLEIILVNNSLTDFLNQVKYLEDINEGVEKSLNEIKSIKRSLEQEKISLNKKNTELAALKKDLADKQKKLLSEKESKKYIIDQVSKSENQYQTLLTKAKQEQQSAASEIVMMEKQVRAKLAQIEGNKLEFNDNGYIWPVKKNIVTTYFHDPDYPFRHIFEHPGVDLRAAQGSRLMATASGYVARVKTGGATGYGYIMIIHGNGLSTVYGHVSKIYVKEDDYVVQGQAIGLTGGLPGTPGAGRLTTGPHLHFETRLNGIPVNPLNYIKE